MPRYLTFDEKTATALRTRVAEQQVFEHGAEDAVDYALHSDRDIVALMPTGAARQAVIAVFRKPRAGAKAAAPIAARPETQARQAPARAEERKPVASVPVHSREDAAVRAGGFLGLRDEPVFEEDQPRVPKKQSWWRKIWPEDE